MYVRYTIASRPLFFGTLLTASGSSTTYTNASNDGSLDQVLVHRVSSRSIAATTNARSYDGCSHQQVRYMWASRILALTFCTTFSGITSDEIKDSPSRDDESRNLPKPPLANNTKPISKNNTATNPLKRSNLRDSVIGRAIHNIIFFSL